MVDMTDRAHVHMRLRPLEFLLPHFSWSSLARLPLRA
jgi:hypothetical protein